MRFRSRFGKYLTIGFGAILLLALALSIVEFGTSGLLESVVVATWLWYSCYLLLWRPNVEITDRSVVLNNLLNRIEIPLGNIQRIDTKWALEITTEQGRYVSFSAVAPGRHSSFTASRDDGSYLPETSYVAGTVRPGDLVTSDSGAVAYEIRRRLEQAGLSAGQIRKSLNSKSLILWLLLTTAVLILLF
ncbi:MAG: PH domain-containing protein [Aquiluna sp.]